MKNQLEDAIFVQIIVLGNKLSIDYSRLLLFVLFETTEQRWLLLGLRRKKFDVAFFDDSRSYSLIATAPLLFI